MGSGGFNLIGDSIVSGGAQFPFTLAAVAALFQGASVTYQEAHSEFKTNTSESDLIEKEFGILPARISSIMILLFNLISVSVILVISSKLIFPAGSWSGQVSFAILLLSGMTAMAFQGIEADKTVIAASGMAVAALLSFTTLIGLTELSKSGLPTQIGLFHGTPNILQSILYFYFVLAGFDTLIKFTEESKDPEHDIPRSFYTSNAISTLLTIGVCLAFVVILNRSSCKDNDNIVARIVGTVLGPQAEQVIGIVSIGLMIVTGFICFLAATRYMFSIGGQIKELEALKELDTRNVPWKSVVVAAAVIAFGILNNHVYTLVKISDIFLTITLLLVSAAATKLQASKGKLPWIEGITTAGFATLLSAACLYK